MKELLLIWTTHNIATKKGNRGAAINESLFDLNRAFNFSNCL
jgi:hypothetical protein